jgi:hypothetical protein
MSKKNSIEYTVKVFVNRSLRILYGDIIEMGKSSLTFRYKKPRSSKYAMRTFAMSDVVAYGAAKDQSSITVWDRVVVSTYKGAADIDGDFIKITQEDGKVVFVRASNSESIADEVDAPEGAVSKAKKKKGSAEKKVARK